MCSNFTSILHACISNHGFAVFVIYLVVEPDNTNIGYCCERSGYFVRMSQVFVLRNIQVDKLTSLM